MNIESFVEEVRERLAAVEAVLENASRDKCLDEEKLETAMRQLQILMDSVNVERYAAKRRLTVPLKVCTIDVGMMILDHYCWNSF